MFSYIKSFNISDIENVAEDKELYTKIMDFHQKSIGQGVWANRRLFQEGTKEYSDNALVRIGVLSASSSTQPILLCRGKLVDIHLPELSQFILCFLDNMKDGYKSGRDLLFRISVFLSPIREYKHIIDSNVFMPECTIGSSKEKEVASKFKAFYNTLSDMTNIQNEVHYIDKIIEFEGNSSEITENYKKVLNWANDFVDYDFDALHILPIGNYREVNLNLVKDFTIKYIGFTPVKVQDKYETHLVILVD